MTDYNLAELRILIVDDNEHMRKMIREILRSLNVRNVREVADGSEALTKLSSFAADVVICDWDMQPMNGLIFVEKLRLDEDSANPFVPVIMLTGHTELERVKEARDSGINEFLAKPVSVRGLYQRLCMVIENPRQFVRTDSYTGPDRRRMKSTPATNKGRRSGDKQGAEPPAETSKD